MHNYASLEESLDPEELAIPHHHISEPETSESRWSHIIDLDAFFTRVYEYHQNRGFNCIALGEFLKWGNYSFTSILIFILMYGIDYEILRNLKDHHISDIFIPVDKVITSLTFYGWMLLGFISICIIFEFIRRARAIVKFWDIKQFYNHGLNITDANLENLTWHDIQLRLKEVQKMLHMCIHKRNLTELDIYHRILRHTNYLVAMVNKRLLPPRLNVPLLGEIVYWTKTTKFIIMFLFFWSPWSPFENPWHLKEEYKRIAMREKLAKQFRRHVLWVLVITVIFSPFVALGHCIYYVFSYLDVIRREPGKFGIRYWSSYGKLYLRHFNELDHELHSRLSRAYKPATKYMDSFFSPLLAVFAQHMIFFLGSIISIMVGFSLYCNDSMYVQQVITIGALFWAVNSALRKLLPDETQIYCPETLLEGVVLHTHYLPGDWKNQAHTPAVRSSFQQLFQYRFAAILEEICSGIITPYLLLTYIYPRSLDIIDFFRNFTVSVVGVGDVCSFAQMDIRRHGNPEWQYGEIQDIVQDQYVQGEDGKVELSLMHFTANNPDWVPPNEAKDFVENVAMEAATNPIFASNIDLNTCGDPRAQQRNQSSFMKYDRGATKKSMLNWQAEGPDLFVSANNMRTSALILHNRHHNQITTRQTRSVEETTPLLRNTKIIEV